MSRKSQKIDEFPIGLSEAERQDLEKMIGEFHGNREAGSTKAAREPIQSQLDSITRRLADLTEMVMGIDRQTASLVEVIRLSHRKSELLNQRLDAVIAALKKGRPL